MTAPHPAATTTQLTVIAHDDKKLELAMFALAHRKILEQFYPVATSTFSNVLKENTAW